MLDVIIGSMSFVSPFGSKCKMKVTRVELPTASNLYVPVGLAGPAMT
ncbi:MAG TPA: hypothetical protein VFM18_01235 [Methanosarcina sp.]|nr:hypothetical protein [Methanosarcina sp.]